MYINWSSTLTGFFVGLAYSLVGFAKVAKSEAKTEFSWKKFLPTVILSGIAGGIVGSSGVMPDEATMLPYITMMTSLGIGTLVNKLIQFIWK